MKKGIVLTIIAAIITCIPVSGQKREEKSFDAGFMVTPAYTREGGFGIGANMIGQYRLTHKDSTIAPSSLALNANVSLKGFVTAFAKGTTFFKDSRSRLSYDVRFNRKKLDFWGTTFDACARNTTSKYTRLQIMSDVNYSYRIGRHIYAGLSASLNYTAATSIYVPAYLDGDRKSYMVSGFGASFLYDSRDNHTNPHKGLFLLLKESVYPEFTGNSGMTNWSTSLLLSGYVPAWKGATVAGGVYMKLNNENVVWTLREEVGGVMGWMRGYYWGRYMDACQLCTQVEIRQYIASRFGCVAWVGAGTVFPSLGKLEFRNILPNYGLGLRFEFKKNTNLRLDFGFGKETAGLVFGITEAF